MDGSFLRRVSGIPAFAPYLSAASATKPARHRVVTGLRGAARSLLAGGLGVARPDPSVVLLIVDGPDAALDAVNDLRAFVALEESLARQEWQNVCPTKRHAADAGGTPALRSVGGAPALRAGRRGAGGTTEPRDFTGNANPVRALAEAGSARREKIESLAKDDSWADPHSRAMPENLKARLLLESTLFPAWDVLPTESDRPEGLTLAGRRRVTERLAEIRDRGGAEKPAGSRLKNQAEAQAEKAAPSEAAFPRCYCIAAPVNALLQPTESPGETRQFITLRTGGEHDPIQLARQLSDAGYERTGQVEVRGEFSLRGGILDIFPYTSETPYRIDFFGENIESIKPFDPFSQRSEDPVESIAFADASPAALKKLFSPGAGSGPWSLFDHLPPGALVVFDEPVRLCQRAELYQASLVSGRSICFDLSELIARANSFDTLQLLGGWELPEEDAPEVCATGGLPTSAAPGGAPSGHTGGQATSGTRQQHPSVNQPGDKAFAQLDGEEIHLNCTTLQRLEGDIAAKVPAWRKVLAERDAVIVFCETGGHRHRLGTLFDSAGLMNEGAGRRTGGTKDADAGGTDDADAAGTRAPRLVLGRLSGGFDFRDAGLAAISDREILGRARLALESQPKEKERRAANTVAIQHLMDLQIGDYVVHAAHGIARYLGLARLEKSGRTEDYLTLLFANEVKLYVPAAHIGWVGKYIGGHAAMELSTIGSKVWARKKERATKAVRDIAEDLLKVQAARREMPGIVFGSDTEWQADFEQAFPYTETPDQLAAISSVKKDMEGTCPMDRLICGDVGFGKTEVALRAAFKAAAGGKQVAVLAPTTLLAEQHGRTFRERFSGFPLAVETLSRFKGAREQKKILERLARGSVDVVVGTHRLLQKDVRFKDLGLAIIDEEQRFGVEHKEFFKRLRRSIDVLTLTATPIPRTLHMAMLGLRDISNLAQAPRNRRAIQTKVARVSDDLLRRAILREISRGGQVFVVHPRVYDIVDLKNRLALLVPEARFAVGHGQMDGDDLEDVMARFLRHEIDVLVSTTIVESGLDIPSANTILVHEAGHFGLAELHQLRGRVGRSDVQAYCYLLLPEHSALTPEGLRRLRALEEFDELGAGFQLAMKDLEIRGAGNVLGRQQSGEIAEVGYDLYCKLLEASVKNLRGEKIEEEMEVTLQLRGAAYIPDEYVQDDKVVLEIYRRLDAARASREIDALKSEMIERFGPLPQPVERMFEEAKLRRMARQSSVPYIGIDNEEGRLIFKLHGWDLKEIDRAMRGLPEVKNVRILDGETLSFALSLKAKHDEKALRELVRNLLEPLALYRRRQHATPRAAAVPGP